MQVMPMGKPTAGKRIGGNMFLIEWIYKLLYGPDSVNDLRDPKPRRKGK